MMNGGRSMMDGGSSMMDGDSSMMYRGSITVSIAVIAITLKLKKL